MIAAISRFRVANGLEQSVRDAFLNRPHLVDTAPGFLGMETFTMASDQAAFYLVTRWTDAASFHAWHRSEAHHQSHKGIPRGIKLDKSFTEVVVLERISAVHGPALEEIIADTVPILTRYVSQSSLVHYLSAALDGTLRAFNAALAQSLKASAAQLQGRMIWDLLTDNAAAALRERIESGERRPEETLLVNLVDSDQVPFTLQCHLDVQPDGFTLIGEPLQKAEASLQEQLLQLNNELATLSRENARKSRALEKALADLKNTQAMLVHREKMASLGQMTAGIAHEINNPIAFVFSNQATLQRDFEDLLTFVNGVGESLPELATTAPALYQKIMDQAQALQLEYLAETISSKIQANLEGLERVTQIIRDLRRFSHLDEAEYKPCDLAKGIESTLRFLGPLLKEHDVTLETQLASLPPVLCAPGVLNQAISNVMINAIQASAPGQAVRIATVRDGADVLIIVKDHGVGIAPEHLPRIFDPFFTTKPVGVGTGLGLSIAYQVIESHHGRIDIESIPHAGTTVRIRIPAQWATTGEVPADEEGRQRASE